MDTFEKYLGEGSNDYFGKPQYSVFGYKNSNAKCCGSCSFSDTISFTSMDEDSHDIYCKNKENKEKIGYMGSENHGFIVDEFGICSKWKKG
jgi:hypothetical protein